MSTYTNQFAEKIFIILSPLVGAGMTKSVIHLQSSKLGINEEQLTRENMPIIAENIKKGLISFLGSESASVVARKIAEIQ